MRKRYIYIIGSRVCIMLAVLGLLGCTSGEATIDRDDPQPPVVNDGRVAVDLALSVSATNGQTRMAYDVVNPTVNPTPLDIDGWSVLPFMVPSDQDSIRKTDTPAMNALTDFPNYEKHYLISDQKLNIGVNAFLCYAKAKHAGDYSATNHGSLNATGSGLASKFTLTRIEKPSDSESSPSAKIVAYMNSIALSNGWKESDEASAEFNNFVNSASPLAGSSKNIIAYVKEWYNKAGSIVVGGSDIKDAILNTAYVTVIDNEVTGFKDFSDYPGTLPDGSAVIKWDGTKFAYESFPDYAYPAERYFYANSRIVTSNASQSTHYGNEWSTVVSQYTDGDVVASTTQSVAIKNPLSYGVAGMEIHVKASSGTIGDYSSQPITLGDNTFPLTAVIVGSQVKQNCFFEPDDPTNQEEDEYLIYDKQIKDEGVYLKGEQSKAVYTLGLQTKDDVSLKVVLEFENNRTTAFTSENGVIHPGTKFYMLASVVPPGTGEIGKRVMTRGHMTVVNLTIGSLKTAYNALPNLRSDKLRLFDVVEAVVHKWQPGQTGEHEVYNW